MNSPGILRASKLGAIDFALSGIASLLAVFSMGSGLGDSPVGRFFAIGILIGTPLAYLMQRSLREEIAALVGVTMYTVAILAGFVLARPLNNLLPSQAIPAELALAGRMSFMLMFGSFFAWRDGTLLFQAVPSIALFGMVGSWDTFRQAPLAFFAFLLCLATLFARVHLRTMAIQAERSGYQDLANIHNSAWRWMAGPEWALASAAAIIVISLIGAPILQESMKGVTAGIKINIPAPKPSPRVSAGLESMRGATRTVGTGPADSITDEIVFIARLDRPRYMRTWVYDLFNGQAWQAKGAKQTGVGADDAWKAIRRRVEFPFEIELVSGLYNRIPAPGEVVGLVQLGVDRLDDGTLRVEPPQSRGVVNGTAVASASADGAGRALGLLGGSRYSERTRRLTERVTRYARTAFEKALAIKREIERRCVYNLGAEAVRTEDRVDSFLFESKEGYCDLFASAMAVMAQAAGMRARYVTGFYPIHDERTRDGRYVIRANEAHAWCEIFFENVGWVAFDATEGANQAWGGERGGSPRKPWYQTLWGIATIGLAGIAALWLGIPRAANYLRGSRVRLTPRTHAASLYGSFERAIEKKSGRPRRLHETPFEYMDIAVPKMQSLEELARSLNEKLVAAMYGPADAGPEELAALRKDLKRFGKLRAS